MAPVVFQCVSITQINTGLPPEDHWAIASVSVVTVQSVQWYPSVLRASGLALTLSQCTLAGPVYTGMPLECHWLSQCTLGHHWVTRQIPVWYTRTLMKGFSMNVNTKHICVGQSYMNIYIYTYIYIILPKCCVMSCDIYTHQNIYVTIGYIVEFLVQVDKTYYCSFKFDPRNEGQ